MATQEMTARTGNSGFLDSYFSITQRGSTVRQELLAGLTTFLAMVYSIIVVPNMLGAAGFEQGPVFVATCLIAAFGSLLMGLLYCFLTVTLRANQNVTGLAITTFGVGFGNFFGASMVQLTGSDIPSVALTRTSTYFRAHLPIAEKMGAFGEMFLSYGFLAYVSIVIAIVCAVFLKRTRGGLHLRAVGENPATADAAGINVERSKYMATCIGSMIAGLGGLYYVMDYACGVWSNDGFGDRGWLAIALVIFAIWRPNLAIFGSILFGFLYIVYLFIPGLDLSKQELFKMLPYVVTILVLIVTSMRKKKENQGPAALGLSYFREER